MSGFEVVGLVLGAMGLVPIFKESYGMVKQYRDKRKLKLLSSNINISSPTTALKKTLGDGSTALTTRYDTLYSLYGAKFATGDSISREELSTIIIILQRELILALHIALTGGTIQNPNHLNTVAAKCREDAIVVLGQLAQRLAILAPILSNPGAHPRIQELDSETKLDSEIAKEFVTKPAPSVSYSGSQYHTGEGRRKIRKLKPGPVHELRTYDSSKPNHSRETSYSLQFRENIRRHFSFSMLKNDSGQTKLRKRSHLSEK
ncbi:hypothetical protein TWF730_005249 [Orbilia blumenaviensis]|uniref:Uncharacterized protein n=1 Tax=Orbilia blumenaviensis TaxID=1796055 RepID=A0AAV9VK35_9PEZI